MMQYVGLPVSVGIGPTKTLAKAANFTAKDIPTHNGVFAPSDEAWDEVLEDVPIKRVWGIGYRWAKKMLKQGIENAKMLRDTDENRIRKKYNIIAQRIVLELRGIKCIELDDIGQERKNAACTRSFGTPLTDIKEIRKGIAFFCSTLGTRIREDKQLASQLTVFLSTGRFGNGERYRRSHTVLLPEPTNHTPMITKYAYASLEDIFKPGLRYKQAGVFLSGLIADSGQQFDLFTNRDHAQESSLMKALDSINHRYGRGKIKMAAEGTDPKWAMKQAWKSDKYTTSWDELKKVH